MRLSKAKTFDKGTDFTEVSDFFVTAINTIDPVDPTDELKTEFKYKIQITRIDDSDSKNQSQEEKI